MCSEPHLLQLVLLLIVRHLTAIDEGRLLEIAARPATDYDLSSFGLASTSRGVALIRVSLRSGLDDTGAAREVLRLNREAHYLAPLVSLAEGRLIAGSGVGYPVAYHFFLPIVTDPEEG